MASLSGPLHRLNIGWMLLALVGGAVLVLSGFWPLQIVGTVIGAVALLTPIALTLPDQREQPRTEPVTESVDWERRRQQDKDTLAALEERGHLDARFTDQVFKLMQDAFSGDRPIPGLRINQVPDDALARIWIGTLRNDELPVLLNATNALLRDRSLPELDPQAISLLQDYLLEGAIQLLEQNDWKASSTTGVKSAIYRRPPRSRQWPRTRRTPERPSGNPNTILHRDRHVS